MFVPKARKETHKDPKSWRAISLTNYLLKALEKLACWHTDEKIALKPLYTRQHGLRSDRNTETSTSNVVNYTGKIKNNNLHAIGVFLDIQAAFETMKPKKIRTEQLKYGADKNLSSWYFNYITHRNMYLQIKGVSKGVTCKDGFPQGGVYSDKFWIVVFNEAIQMINKYKITYLTLVSIEAKNFP